MKENQTAMRKLCIELGYGDGFLYISIWKERQSVECGERDRIAIYGYKGRSINELVKVYNTNFTPSPITSFHFGKRNVIWK